MEASTLPPTSQVWEGSINSLHDTQILQCISIHTSLITITCILKTGSWLAGMGQRDFRATHTKGIPNNGQSGVPASSGSLLAALPPKLFTQTLRSQPDWSRTKP